MSMHVEQLNSQEEWGSCRIIDIEAQMLNSTQDENDTTILARTI